MSRNIATNNVNRSWISFFNESILFSQKKKKEGRKHISIRKATKPVRSNSLWSFSAELLVQDILGLAQLIT